MAQSAALISTEELARRMGAPALRIFDCTTYLRPRPEGGYNAESGRANYDKGHLPGAAFLDLGGELSDPQSRLRFTLPPLDQLTRAFAAKGIGHGTFVVLYSHATPTWATRVWWMLRAVGFDEVAILDGGLDKWKAREPPALDRGHDLSAGHAQPARTARDLRRQKRHQGGDRQDRHADLECAQPRPAQGHGWRGLRPRRPHRGLVLRAGGEPVRAGQTLKPIGELRAAFEGVGAAPDKRVLVYCGGGIAATLDAFVLTAMLGHKNVSVYDNSMQEWSNDPSLPMETG